MNWTALLNFWPLAAFAVLCLLTLIQLGFFLFIFRKLAVYKPQTSPSTRTQPVSVIICARDEAANLEEHLPQILTQQYSTTHEILLVNDNSTDDSKYFLEELSKIFKHLNVINLTQEAKHIPGKKYPLSIGIKSSKHEVMLLTDADCKPASPMWIEKMQAGYTDGIEIVLGYGQYEKTPGLLNKLIRFETWHTALQYFSFALAGMPYMGVGRNLSYRKGLFFKVKGFSSINHIPGGDDDLFINKVCTPHNTNIVIDSDAFTISKPAASFGAWWRQKSRHYSTAKFYSTKHRFYLGLYAASYALFIPFLVASAIFFNWQMALALYGVRLITLAIVWQKSMKKLQESDLFPMFILLDIWQCFYYFIFSITLFKKPASNWQK